jgi:hypothetical protein
MPACPPPVAFCVIAAAAGPAAAFDTIGAGVGAAGEALTRDAAGACYDGSDMMTYFV